MPVPADPRIEAAILALTKTGPTGDHEEMVADIRIVLEVADRAAAADAAIPSPPPDALTDEELHRMASDAEADAMFIDAGFTPHGSQKQYAEDVPRLIAEIRRARAAVVSPPPHPVDEVRVDVFRGGSKAMRVTCRRCGTVKEGDVDDTGQVACRDRLVAALDAAPCRAVVASPEAYEQVGWCWPNERGPASDFPFSISTHLVADVGGEPVFRRVVRDENEPMRDG